MRAGISRVVVEIIILVIAVALALLIFSPISGYIFGSLGRTSTVGGASQIQVLNAQYSSGSGWTIYVKNLGPGTPAYTDSNYIKKDFKVYIDQQECSVDSAVESPSLTDSKAWEPGEVIKITCDSSSVDGSKQRSIVVYGPGNTQTQYLYYPPPS